MRFCINGLNSLVDFIHAKQILLFYSLVHTLTDNVYTGCERRVFTEFISFVNRTLPSSSSLGSVGGFIGDILDFDVTKADFVIHVFFYIRN